jgi:hypothetical protein
MFGGTPVDLTVEVQRPIHQPAPAVGKHLENALRQSLGVAISRVVQPVGQAVLVVRAEEARQFR